MLKKNKKKLMNSYFNSEAFYLLWVKILLCASFMPENVLLNLHVFLIILLMHPVVEVVPMKVTTDELIAHLGSGLGL